MGGKQYLEIDNGALEPKSVQQQETLELLMQGSMLAAVVMPEPSTASIDRQRLELWHDSYPQSTRERGEMT